MVYFCVLCSKNILMKLVGYQQPTCLCVRMEFVVGIISLSCEVYSLSWSCFRSRGSGTIVYRKWCFDLHVECYGSCMVSTVGVGASTFLRVRRSFARNFPNLPETFWATLPINFSLKGHEVHFWDDLQKRSSCVFLQTLGTILWNQTRLGAIFVRIFRDFAQIFNK